MKHQLYTKEIKKEMDCQLFMCCEAQSDINWKVFPPMMDQPCHSIAHKLSCIDTNCLLCLIWHACTLGLTHCYCVWSVFNCQFLEGYMYLRVCEGYACCSWETEPSLSPLVLVQGNRENISRELPDGIRSTVDRLNVYI